MPGTKPKPSEIAAEAKRVYMPHIWRHYLETSVTSYFYPDAAAIKISSERKSQGRTRVAVMEGDPVDYALGWNQVGALEGQASRRMPVVNMANEKRAGGDWESGLMAPEECFARRSNLVHALTMPWNQNHQARTSEQFYPIPQRGGIYSPDVYVFREGADKNYGIYKDIKSLPVISVAPVRRPKLDETGAKYSFSQEKELMREKMRAVLRIAAYCGHTTLCIGAFGVGPIFRNPVGEVARMWRRLLYEEDEFRGVFTDVVFAIENGVPACAGKGLSDLDTFRQEFDPSALFPTRYR